MFKTTHIVYISYEPYIHKYGEDFYFKDAVEAGFTVEYWNLYAVYHSKEKASEALTHGIEKKISSFVELENQVKVYKDLAFFIFKINYSGKVFRLFRLFSIYKCNTGFFARGALPFPHQSQSLRKKFSAKFKAFRKYSFIKNAVLNQLALQARKKKLVLPFTYVFYAGSESFPVIGYGYNYGLNLSSLIPVNSFDYDKYFLLKHSHGRIVAERYCVFLDTYLPFHPDFDLLKMPKVDAEKYYSSLNRFFEYIEKLYNIKVVIAAHPKSDYENSKAYKHRLIKKNKTAELIKDSEFVITHASTSVSFAVLFEKKILFTYTDEIKKIYEYGQYALVINFAQILNASCINIDDNLPYDFKILPEDISAYKNYKYKYLTNVESENELSQTIFKNFLRQKLHASI